MSVSSLKTIQHKSVMSRPSRPEYDQSKEYTDYEQGLDLLRLTQPGQKSKQFKVTFGFYKASPHLVILNKNRQLKNRPTSTDFKLDSPSDQAFLRELVRVARDVTDRLLGASDEIKFDALLSIHRDGWASRKNCFHAHIAFGHEGKDKYLEIFSEFKGYEPMSNFWPQNSGRFVTEQWSKLPKNLSAFETRSLAPAEIDRIHADSVRGYPLRSYKNEDAENAKNRNYNENMPQLPQIDKLRFHHSLPQIGLVWRPRPSSEEVDDLCDYIKDLHAVVESIKKLADGDYDGCHMCVSLSRRPLPDFEPDQGEVRGYIQLSAPVYCMFYPQERRAQWLKSYVNVKDDRVFT